MKCGDYASESCLKNSVEVLCNENYVKVIIGLTVTFPQGIP